jgi:hypothetical protein
MGSFGVVAIPFGVAGLVALEPLEEPVLRPAQLLINRNR